MLSIPQYEDAVVAALHRLGIDSKTAWNLVDRFNSEVVMAHAKGRKVEAVAKALSEHKYSSRL